MRLNKFLFVIQVRESDLQDFDRKVEGIQLKSVEAVKEFLCLHGNGQDDPLIDLVSGPAVLSLNGSATGKSARDSIQRSLYWLVLGVYNNTSNIHVILRYITLCYRRALTIHRGIGSPQYFAL